MYQRSVCAAAAVGCLTVAAFSADLHVPSDFPTIQAAIDAAEPSDRILIADGTYAGPGFGNLDTAGKSITIRSVNGPDACILDGGPTPGAHAFVFSSAEHAGTRIEDLTFRGFTTSAGDEGAVRIIGSSPAFEGCIFDQCSTASAPNPTTPGSAVALVQSAPIFTACTFTSNEGSAFHTDGTSVVYLIDCTFEDNVTRPDDGRGGAAVFSEGFTLTFDSFYRRNRVESIAGPAHGGAIAQYGSMLDLTGATFEDNSVAGPGETGGSAVYVESPFVMNGNVVESHAGDHDNAAVLIVAADPVFGFDAFISGSFIDNHVGAIRIDDPDQLLEIRIGSTEFCENELFDIEGPYFDWGANDLCCPADINGSGSVDIIDLLSVLDMWGACPDCFADLNADGLVNILDLLTLLDSWGACPELPPAI